MKHKKYRLISQFDTKDGKHLYTVMINGNAHVIDQSELDKIIHIKMTTGCRKKERNNN